MDAERERVKRNGAIAIARLDGKGARHLQALAAALCVSPDAVAGALDEFGLLVNTIPPEALP